MAAFGGLYGVASWRLRRRIERPTAWQRSAPLCFAAGWAVLALALASPLDAWSDLLFAAHMTQHELLMLVAAPLIVLAQPLAVLPWAFSQSVRLRLRALPGSACT